jgi:ATP-binding cassette subfamily B protein
MMKAIFAGSASRRNPTSTHTRKRVAHTLFGGAAPGEHAAVVRGIADEVRAVGRYAILVWRMVSPAQKFSFGCAGILMILTAGFNTAIPVLLGRVVDCMKTGSEENTSTIVLHQVAGFYLGLVACAYLTREALQVARRYLVERCCTRIEKDITVQVASHLMKVDLDSLHRQKVGALQGRISRSVVGFVRFLRLAFLDLFPPVFGGVFALVTALVKQPWLAIAMIGVIPFSMLFTIRQINSQKGIRLKLIRSREAMDGTMVEVLSGMDYVRAADTHEYELKRVDVVAEDRRTREVRHHFLMSLFGCGKALNEALFHIMVLAVAIHLALRGDISLGDILTFSMLFLSVMAPFNEIHRGLDEGHECSLQVADLLAILDKPIDRSFSSLAGREPRLAYGRPAIVVRNLSVDYPTGSGHARSGLRDVSMIIDHGETIGVVGPSGCGKSTWLRVMMRLVHPSRGQATIGGVPLESVSREAIGRLIGYVDQSAFVFAGTIAENIAYGSSGASEQEIRHAAQAAYIHDEIMAMPGGYRAMVCERGHNLSGGQRQRLALARVFLKNPPILILDEGTSALDTISERKIQKAINAARADHTIILVAHRLSTLRHADRIFVFNEGRVIESGSFAELTQQNGLFTELACAANH